MNRKALVLVLGAFVVTAVASLISAPGTSESSAIGPNTTKLEQSGDCSGGPTASTDAPDPYRVPPGCCTSNCNTNKDCDRICGKGNCVCIVTNDCCRRCTY